MPVSVEEQDAGEQAPPEKVEETPVPFFGKCAVLVATGFGIGRIPFAPGTFGALLGIPLALAVTSLHGHLWTQIAIVAALTLIAVPICDAAEQIFGVKDDDRIVADEFMLFPICFVGTNSLIAVEGREPASVWEMLMGGGLDAKTAVVFIVFVFVISRICDILKPAPAHQIQAVKGGLGVVLDDFFASLYTWILVWGLKDWAIPKIMSLL